MYNILFFSKIILTLGQSYANIIDVVQTAFTGVSFMIVT